MTTAKTFSVRASIIALTLAAVPAASSAMQQPVSGLTNSVAVQQPVAVPALSQPTAPVAQAPEQSPLIAEAASLNAGDFVWRPELATSGRVEMVVSIPQQRAYIYRGGTLIGVTTVSTGRSGHRTPTGTFPIMEKHREHYSSIYDGAPMPFMQRLTMGGIALHAGVIPGYPASHGCVRLPYEMARNLFGATSVGARVHIISGSPAPHDVLAYARGERLASGRVAMVSDVNVAAGTR
jgi:lipoprotein-anchoring transpeptidase ErfK/SrfK